MIKRENLITFFRSSHRSLSQLTLIRASNSLRTVGWLSKKRVETRKKKKREKKKKSREEKISTCARVKRSVESTKRFLLNSFECAVALDT